MRRCVITLGIGLCYHLGVRRLKRSIKKQKVDADFLEYLEYPEGCPRQEEMPFAFKYYLLDQSRKAGYQQAIYLDASYMARDNLEAVWKHLEEHGYYFTREELVPSIGHFCHDQAVKQLDLDREELFKWKSLRGGCFGLDFNNPKSKPNQWLDRMIELSRDGICFPGSRLNEPPKYLCSSDTRVLGHLHDQTIGSIIAYELGMAYGWSEFTDHFFQDRALVKPGRTTIFTTRDWENQYWWGQKDFSLQ